MARQPKKFSTAWWQTRCKFIIESELRGRVSRRECINKKGPDGGHCYQHRSIEQ